MTTAPEPLDEGFFVRINGLYATWRERYAAALIVAAQMGIWGTGKSSRSKDIVRQTANGLCDYLESLRP